jgi:hypothetical protein
MLIQEWQADIAEEDQTTEYPVAVDLWQVEQLLNDLLAETHAAQASNGRMTRPWTSVSR